MISIEHSYGHINRYKHIFLAVSYCVLLASCKTSAANDQWGEFLKGIGINQENILCEDRLDQDRVLIAWVHKTLLTAYRIKVTVEDGKVRPSVVSWSFRNENESGLELTTPPRVVAEHFIEEQGNLYSEVAEYRHLAFEGSSLVKVRIGIRKSENRLELAHDGSYDLTRLEKTLLCEIPTAILK